jgi:hypothetical protein
MVARNWFQARTETCLLIFDRVPEIPSTFTWYIPNSPYVHVSSPFKTQLLTFAHAGKGGAELEEFQALDLFYRHEKVDCAVLGSRKRCEKHCKTAKIPCLSDYYCRDICFSDITLLLI